MRQNSATEATGPSEVIPRSGTIRYGVVAAQELDRRNHPEIDGLLVQQRGAFRRRVEAQREVCGFELQSVNERTRVEVADRSKPGQ